MNTQKPYKYFVINSIDRIDKLGTPSDISVKLPFGTKFNHAQLINFKMANTYFNINDNNNKLVVNNVGYTLTKGNYNLDELFTALVNLVPVFDSISYDDVIAKVTIVTVGAVVVPLNFISRLNRVLGFPDDYNQTGASFISTNPPYLSHNLLYAEIDKFSTNFTSTNDMYKSPSFLIDNNVNKNDLISYSQNSQYEQLINLQNNDLSFYNLSIKLKDHNGHVLEGCSEWTMLLKLF